MTLEEYLASATSARDSHRDNFHKADGVVTILQALIKERDTPKTGMSRTAAFRSALAMALLLCSCTDPNAGMVAARRMGQTHYLSVPKDGKLMSAAVFNFNGMTHIYIPWIGSSPIPTIDPVSIFSGSSVEPVRPLPRSALLTYACLPSAIIDVREKGGKIVKSKNHYYRAP